MINYSLIAFNQASFLVLLLTLSCSNRLWRPIWRRTFRNYFVSALVKGMSSFPCDWLSLPLPDYCNFLCYPSSTEGNGYHHWRIFSSPLKCLFLPPNGCSYNCGIILSGHFSEEVEYGKLSKLGVEGYLPYYSFLLLVPKFLYKEVKAEVS